MNGIKEFLIVILPAIVLGIISSMCFIGIANISLEQEYHAKRIESIKGACIEYEGDIKGNFILNGSHGNVKCIAWENINNKNQIIRYENGNYTIIDKANGE